MNEVNANLLRAEKKGGGVFGDLLVVLPKHKVLFWLSVCLGFLGELFVGVNYFSTHLFKELPSEVVQTDPILVIRNEIDDTHVKLHTAFPDRQFYPLSSSTASVILEATNKYDLSEQDRLWVVKHAAQVVASLEVDTELLDSINSITGYNPFLNIVHPNEYFALYTSIQDILKAEQEYILKYNDPYFFFSFKPKTDADIALLVDATVGLEALKTEMPPRVRDATVRLLRTLDPSYSYHSGRLDDPLNDLVVVKDSTNLINGIEGNSIGGGHINLSLRKSSDALALIIFHEKMHQKMKERFDLDHPHMSWEDNTAFEPKAFQEIGATTFEYLSAEQASVATSSVAELDYWPGASDIISMIKYLEKYGAFQFESDKDMLLQAFAEGDLTPLLVRYVDTMKASKIPTTISVEQLKKHFDLVRDGFFHEQVSGDYPTSHDKAIRVFNAESVSLGLKEVRDAFTSLDIFSRY